MRMRYERLSLPVEYPRHANHHMGLYYLSILEKPQDVAGGEGDSAVGVHHHQLDETLVQVSNKHINVKFDRTCLIADRG